MQCNKILQGCKKVQITLFRVMTGVVGDRLLAIEMPAPVGYAGQSPKEYTSGKSIKGRVRISKIGGGQLRHTLYMCALNAKSTNKACKALYDRLVAKGKNKKLALIAVCNKLLKQVFAVVKSGTLYQDDFQKIIA